MRKIILSLILLIVTGCSAMESVKTANTQNLIIQTPNVENAECQLSDRTGRKWRLFETPGTVAVQEGHPPLVVICTKKGFKKSVLTINERKEEILTIDGKRIDFSIYGDFPTKFPRLIPAAIKEVAGFAQDPTGSISTNYPNEITVWMEPKVWESEDQMREWALEREIFNRAEFNSEEDAQLSNQQRKEKRRAEQKARKDYIKKVKKRLQDGGKKAVKNTLKVLNPEPIAESIMKMGRESQGLSKARDRSVKGAQSFTDTISERAPRIRTQAAKKLGGEAENIIDSVNPGSAVDFLNHRNQVKAKTQKLRLEEKSIDKNTINSKDPSAYDDSPNLPRNLPAPVNINEPQDLFENDQTNESKFEYDEHGRRIVP